MTKAISFAIQGLVLDFWIATVLVCFSINGHDWPKWVAMGIGLTVAIRLAKTTHEVIRDERRDR